MGLDWLNAVQDILERAGFTVARGYPGTDAVKLTGTAAVVNLTQVDLTQMHAVITVTVLVPRRAGLGYCQEMALKAASVLAEDGNHWGFSGWKYENGIDAFSVEVVGTASFAPQEIPELGYEVMIGEEIQEYVTDFLARQKTYREFIRAHGDGEPVGITPGLGGWTIRLTQMLPGGTPEPGQSGEGFIMTVRRGGQGWKYHGCCWTEYSTQQCAEGIRVIRTGLALSREVDENG